MAAPEWLTDDQRAAFERGQVAADACAGLAGHQPAHPTFDPTYRPQVRTPAPHEPYTNTMRKDPAHPWEWLAGLVCTCRPGCTSTRWGDAGICDPRCQPCRRMAAEPYVKPPKSARSSRSPLKEIAAA